MAAWMAPAATVGSALIGGLFGNSGKGGYHERVWATNERKDQNAWEDALWHDRFNAQNAEDWSRSHANWSREDAQRAQNF